MLTPIRFDDDGLSLLDQRKLPHSEQWLTCDDLQAVIDAIRSMVVRGAPAIGVTAAYGLVLAGRRAAENATPEQFADRLAEAAEALEGARPTAVNLGWAVRRLLGVARRALDDGLPVDDIVERLTHEAQALHEEDVEANRNLGYKGSMFVPEGARVMTHCNTGALATGGYGTALGVIRAAVEEGKQISVLANETRPFLQGARLTAWELHRDGIPVELVNDSAAGALMARGDVDLVIVGADRIAANGDVANKIGTYTLAVLARRHGIPFYVAAPTSTIDASARSGHAIPIEIRDSDEVLNIGSEKIAPEGVRARHIAFDITPASLVTAIVTEEGILRPPYEPAVAKALGLEFESPAPILPTEDVAEAEADEQSEETGEAIGDDGPTETDVRDDSETPETQAAAGPRSDDLF